MMTLRIVCTLEAVKTAQTLMRVLSAEGYNVELSHGRGSLDFLDQSVAAKEAVILIWSFEAHSAQHMLQWQKAVDPELLIEIARAPGAPDLPKRRGPVIDFSSWSGERAGGGWRGLQERLRAVARVTEPHRPVPARALIALGAVSMAAVTGAFVIRAGDHAAEPAMTAEKDPLTLYDIDVGLGGPLSAEEPASEGDPDITFAPVVRRADAISATPESVMLASGPIAPPLEAREAQLLERLADFASPLIDEIRR